MNKEFEKPITYLKGVGPKRAELYERLDINTVYDLLYHFPRYYIDYSSPVPISDCPTDEPCVIKCEVVKKLPEAPIRRGLSIYKAVLTDGESDCVLIIYNAGYLFANLEVGKEYYFYGKLTGNLIRREISSPLILSADEPYLCQPVYHLTEGLTQFALRQTVHNALSGFDKEIYEPLPKWIMQKYQLCSLNYALENIHFPQDLHCSEVARNRLVFDEFITLQLGMRLIKGRQREQSGCVMSQTDITDYLKFLPFELTGSQKTAIDDCMGDMCNEYPMNRLVQGDVGSGKTAVAAGCAYIAYKNGYQTALMAPTEILATQHYKTLCDFLSPLGIKCCLLTGSLTAKNKAGLKEKISKGEYGVVVGTHALVQQSTVFHRLGLVITDEQHRFGVEQRAMLAGKGENPHKLVMSATPIPRTLALMIYGDLDISVLRELPKGRQPIETYAVTGKLRERAFNFVKTHLEQGRQAYIVCPMIDDNDMDLRDVKTYQKDLSTGAFKNYNVGLLHGKLAPLKKEQVMADFRDGKINVLVSTTVVEVGVDVPNAVVMVIENADRFGLSQLHQLRGRVGRGEYKSYCVLITDNNSEESRKRLKILSKTSDGFEISEEDLKLRGPGDFFGSRQHGLPKLKIADMSENIDILRQAQHCAKLIESQDKTLESPEYKGLRELAERLFKQAVSDN